MSSPSCVRRFVAAALLVASFSSLRADLYSVHLSATGGNPLDITGTVDTAADSFVIETWVASNQPWNPKSAAFPITLYAYTLANIGTSVAYDVADNWDGTMSGWAFMLPQGTGVGDIPWVEGYPVFAPSSFGWGGARNTPGYTLDIGGTGVNGFQYVPTSIGAVDIPLSSVEITAIPKPVPESASTLALFGLATSGLLTLQRRRRMI